MIPALLAAQIARKNRANQKAQLLKRRERLLAKAQQVEENDEAENEEESDYPAEEAPVSPTRSRTAKTPAAPGPSRNKSGKEKNMSLLRGYMNLLKTTFLSFLLSTLTHVAIVSSYYAIYLWLHPDDPDKKKFYSATKVNPGVNIGGRMVGGGGIQTNHNKSYLFHVIREHYKSLSNFFFVQFSLLYLLFLSLFKFFPNRAKLKEETSSLLDNLMSNQESTSATTEAKAAAKKKPKKRSESVSRRKKTN